MTIHIYVDGGCRGNGGANPQAYGSYAVVYKDEVKRLERLVFPVLTTNNQAEYASLASVIVYLNAVPERLVPEISIHTDSLLMVGQCTLGWKVKDEWLKRHVPIIKSFLEHHPNIKLIHTGRDIIVSKLGH
jgi:ribonuclease HI